MLKIDDFVAQLPRNSKKVAQTFRLLIEDYCHFERVEIKLQAQKQKLQKPAFAGDRGLFEDPAIKKIDEMLQLSREEGQLIHSYGCVKLSGFFARIFDKIDQKLLSQTLSQTNKKDENFLDYFCRKYQKLHSESIKHYKKILAADVAAIDDRFKNEIAELKDLVSLYTKPSPEIDNKKSATKAPNRALEEPRSKNLSSAKSAHFSGK